MKDYSELKMLAEKATPGPWHIDSHGMTMTSMESFQVIFNHPSDRPAVRHEETGNLSSWRNDWDASFIASANPSAVLALIAEVDGLHAQHGLDSAELRSLCQARDDARKERDQLKAANDQLMEAIGNQTARRFVGDDDQRKIDDLVAAGIREDKRLIGQLKAKIEQKAEEYDKSWRHDLNDKNNVQVLAAEVDALRKDAERYRWLRNSDQKYLYCIAESVNIDSDVDDYMRELS